MMNEPTAPPSSISDYFAALRRRYMYFATVLPIALFACVVAAFAIHPLYQATATIMLEPSSVPKDIIESTVITYSDQQVEIVQGRVLTAASLAPVLKQVDPYPKEKNLSEAQKVLDKLKLDSGMGQSIENERRGKKEGSAGTVDK